MSLGLHNFILLFFLFASQVLADPIQKNFAKLKLLDKTSNNVSEKNIGVNSSNSWGSLDVYIHACYTSPPDEIPENYVLLEIIDKLNNEKEFIYQGWMISSSPDISPLEHPVYDLWLIDCN